jgi:NAD(P)-dependent dehydrogenase (short-subunit alcohol dehydrogenase family)
MASTTDLGLDGRVVLVTGTASGIGRASAELLAGQGARVVASDLDGERGAAVAAALRDGGAAIRFVAGDVAEEGTARALVDAALETYGRLDGAVNCAGVGGGHGETHDYPVPEWDRILAVNLRGTWLAMKRELAAILAHGDGGAIVNVASTLGLRGAPFASAYSASKHGVIGLTRTAAIEYAQRRIRVNAVCPGAIDTPMMDATFARFPGFREALTGYVPLGRMGAPAEVAAAIAWLLSDAASFVTGEALTVEGGLLSR